jgi:hypothetical protein
MMSCDYAWMNENVQLVIHYSDYNCVCKYRMIGSKLTLSTYIKEMMNNDEYHM